MSRPLFKYLGLILILLTGFTGFQSVPSRSGVYHSVALAASDPVIAVAGNIACDPINPGFNGEMGQPPLAAKNTLLTYW